MAESGQACSTKGCTTPPRVRGMCQTHYAQAWRAEHPQGTGRTCSAPGCDDPAAARELCHRHWRAQRAQGFPDAPRARKPQNGDCSVDGCTTPARIHGMCGMHEKRQRRNGDPHKVLRVHRPRPASKEVSRG